MVYLISLLILLSGCSTVIYKCPPGQVEILENRGTSFEKKACYTPGVSYTDYRPIATKQIKSLGA